MMRPFLCEFIILVPHVSERVKTLMVPSIESQHVWHMEERCVVRHPSFVQVIVYGESCHSGCCWEILIDNDISFGPHLAHQHTHVDIVHEYIGNIQRYRNQLFCKRWSEEISKALEPGRIVIVRPSLPRYIPFVLFISVWTWILHLKSCKTQKHWVMKQIMVKVQESELMEIIWF